MAHRVRQVTLLARVAIATAFLAGCAPAPADSSEPSTPEPSSSPLATQVVAPPATAAEHLTVRWERFPDFDRADDVRFVHGPGGWFGFGECVGASLDTCSPYLFSPDARTWSPVPLGGSAELETFGVVAGAMGYVLVAHDRDSDDRPSGDLLPIWRSSDGEAWERAGHFRADPCTRDRGCLSPFGLAVAPSGAIAIGDVYDGAGVFLGTGPYVSSDGVEWRAVGAEGLGVARYTFNEIQSLPSEILLAGRPCAGCDMHVWSSADGETWRDTGELTSGEAPRRAGIRSFATDGDRTIAAMGVCDGGGCSTELWSTEAGGSWTRRLVRTGMEDAEVVFTGTAFLAIGIGEQNYVQLASFDGLTWIEVPNDGLSGGNDEDCSPAVVAAEGTVLIGTPSCGTWRGIVEVAPGTAPTLEPTEVPAPASTPYTATVPPSERLETRVELVESCLWEPGQAQVTFEISWEGTVRIEGYDTSVDGGDGAGGSAGFASTTSHSDTYGFDAFTGVRHVILVSFRADFDGDGLYGPIVREVEVPFTVDPENSCR